jgi:hypothetical protein
MRSGRASNVAWAASCGHLQLPDCNSCYLVRAMPSTANIDSPADDAERERIVVLLRAHAEDIRGRGVTRLALFGSTARGEAGPSSDVDLLIEVDPHARFTLVDLAGLERF